MLISQHDMEQWGDAAGGMVEAAWAACCCLPSLVGTRPPTSVLAALGLYMRPVTDVQKVQAVCSLACLWQTF
jgi:hypothetical protein